MRHDVPLNDYTMFSSRIFDIYYFLTTFFSVINLVKNRILLITINLVILILKNNLRLINAVLLVRRLYNIRNVHILCIMGKIRTTINLNKYIVLKARELGLNISTLTEEKLIERIKEIESLEQSYKSKLTITSQIN